MIPHESTSQPEIFLHPFIKLKLDAGNLIYAEYSSASAKATDGQANPSLAYLQSLDPTKAIYNPLTEIHQSYDQTNRNLTNTSQALIAAAAAAIAIGTEGIGTGISGAILTAGATTTGTIATTSATNASMNADGSAINQLKTTTKTAVKDTTSKESLQAIAISAAAAGLAQGAMQASGFTNAANATSAPNTVTGRLTTNLSIGLQKAAIHSTSNILATSAIKGQSLNQTIQEQGGGEKILINTALNALAEMGAKEIGIAAHAGDISKATQLTLHGIVGCALGATISALRGNDNTAGIISGAAAAAVGELAADSAYSSGTNANKSIAIGQAAGSLAALTTSIALGASDEQTAKNIQLGNYLAGNATINNTLLTPDVGTPVKGLDDEDLEQVEQTRNEVNKAAAKGVYEVSPMGVSERIENYTGYPLTWEKGEEATFKLKGSEFATLNSRANNIGTANSVWGGESNFAKHPLSMNLNYAPSFVQEGGAMSVNVNKIPGMNAMSVFHDKWTDGALMGQHGLLEGSIFVAIPITYYGLIGKEIRELYQKPLQSQIINQPQR